MTKTLHIKLTGEAEKLLSEMGQLGVNEQSAIAQALSLLKLAHETKRVALLKPNADQNNTDLVVEYTLVLGGIETTEQEEEEFAEVATHLDRLREQIREALQTTDSMDAPSIRKVFEATDTVCAKLEEYLARPKGSLTPEAQKHFEKRKNALSAIAKVLGSPASTEEFSRRLK